MWANGNSSRFAATKKHLGTLDRVRRAVRLGVFIATFGDFFDHPRVADGALDLFHDVFGVEKAAVRLVIGVAIQPSAGKFKVFCECTLESQAVPK